MGGTFDMPSARLISVSTSLFLRGGKAGVGERGGCTLLGPEGSEPLGAVPRGPAFALWKELRGGCRPYFENYTVDASILKKRTSTDYFVDGSCDFVSL